MKEIFIFELKLLFSSTEYGKQNIEIFIGDMYINLLINNSNDNEYVNTTNGAGYFQNIFNPMMVNSNYFNSGNIEIIFMHLPLFLPLFILLRLR